MRVLGIESSCDDTSLALVRDGRLLAMETASQTGIHALFGGVVPDTIEELTTLPGIGRKTANLVVGDIYGKPAVVVDTHCIRITSRLGFHNIKDAGKIEKILRELLPPEESNDFCHRLVLHGRAVCDARKPRCEQCCMREFCDTALGKK